jgi:outer membrane cobalamin receptor
MRLLHIFIISTLICALSATASFAESDDLEDLSTLSLDELLGLEVSVASISARTTREQSAIVSVITAREISASGARDLLDVLWLVPGFNSGVDVEGVTGVGIRGFWAYDGKILITVDGMDITERLYGTVPLGDRIPVDMIERIEIIRGPGSAMYGDNAELAVINIVTKGPKLDGGFVSGGVGTDGDDVSGRAGAAVGTGNGDDVHVDIAGFWSTSYRSTSNYTDNDGVVVDLDGNSDIDALFLNAGMDFKDLHVRMQYDQYEVEDEVQYGWAIPRYDNSFSSFGVSGKYDFELSEVLTISPEIIYNYQEPWKMAIPDEEY